MKYKKYAMDRIPIILSHFKNDFKESYGFYQSIDFAYTVEILNLGRAFFFVNNEKSIYLLGYETLEDEKKLSIIRPEHTMFLFELLEEIQHDYKEISIITDNKDIIKRYISKIKKTGYFVTPIIDLQNGPEQILMRYDSNRKNILKRAKKKSFEFIMTPSLEDISDFAKLYCSAMEKEEYYEEIYSVSQFVKLLKLDSYHLFLCKYQGIIVAGTILIYYGDTVEERYIVVNSDYKKVQGGTVLKDYCINYCEKFWNAKYYDLGGYTCLQGEDSKLGRINSFKMAFGPELKKYYSFSI